MDTSFLICVLSLASDTIRCTCWLAWLLNNYWARLVPQVSSISLRWSVCDNIKVFTNLVNPIFGQRSLSRDRDSLPGTTSSTCRTNRDSHTYTDMHTGTYAHMHDTQPAETKNNYKSFVLKIPLLTLYLSRSHTHTRLHPLMYGFYTYIHTYYILHTFIFMYSATIRGSNQARNKFRWAFPFSISFLKIAATAENDNMMEW